MTAKGEKHTCPKCQAVVRRIGKHVNQKHPGVVIAHALDHTITVVD